MASANGPQTRLGAAVAIGLWLIATLIVPTVIDVDRGVVTTISIGMASVNLVGVISLRWATTLDRQQAIGFTLNGLAGLAVLALIAVSGTTDPYAAPALLLIAIFAFESWLQLVWSARSGGKWQTVVEAANRVEKKFARMAVLLIRTDVHARGEESRRRFRWRLSSPCRLPSVTTREPTLGQGGAKAL